MAARVATETRMQHTIAGEGVQKMLPRSVPGRRHRETRCLSTLSLSMSVLAPQGSDPRRVFTTGWPCNERALERVRAERAARYAVDFMNALHGSPLHSYDHGQLCSWKRNEDYKGADYQLECEVEEQPSKRKLKVMATVLFPPGRETPRVNITSELSPHEEAYDEAWEENLREYPGQSLGENIPDNFGHVPHNKTALLRLARVAGSVINLENGGEHKTYDLQRINSVALSLLSRDSLRIFDYEVITVEMPTQEIVICYLTVAWQKGEPIRVKYLCPKLAALEMWGSKEEDRT